MRKIIVSLVLSTCIIYANSTAKLEEVSIKELFDTQPNLAPVEQKSIPIPIVVKKQAVVEKTYNEVIEVSRSYKMLLRDETREVVVDGKSNLMWQDNGDVKTEENHWNDSIEYCENLSFAGHQDWRVPNTNELFSITDDTKVNPAILSVFKNVSSSRYWTSDKKADQSSRAWYINFHGGDDGYNSIYNTAYVRCVRDNK